jgi:hypothetical protein
MLTQDTNKDPRKVANARMVGKACGDAKMSPWQAQDFAMSTVLGRVLLNGASEYRAVEGTTNHAYWTAYHEAREEAYRGA